MNLRNIQYKKKTVNKINPFQVHYNKNLKYSFFFQYLPTNHNFLEMSSLTSSPSTLYLLPYHLSTLTIKRITNRSVGCDHSFIRSQ